MPTKVIAEDLDTGDVEVHIIEDNWVLIRDGKAYVANVQHYYTTGTTQLTIKIGDPE